MKKIYMLCVMLSCYSLLIAQNIISIAPGTDFYISPGTQFSAGGLSITPSIGYNLKGTTWSKTNTVSYFTQSNYISRVYQSPATTMPFSGVIQINYEEPELNGIIESALELNFHDGSSWHSVTSSENNTVSNYVLTIPVSNAILKEITLSDAAYVLPLQWGNINAYRAGKTVNVDWLTKQESNVSHFTVERSLDSRNWTVVKDNIVATNTTAEKQYAATDLDYNASRLFYRIKQTDIGGKFLYSPVAAVSARSDVPAILVYPNPVNTGFYISNVAANDIRVIELFDNAGLQVKSWTSAQPSYLIENLPAGIYNLRVQFKNDSNQYFKLIKQ